MSGSRINIKERLEYEKRLLEAVAENRSTEITDYGNYCSKEALRDALELAKDMNCSDYIIRLLCYYTK